MTARDDKNSVVTTENCPHSEYNLAERMAWAKGYNAAMVVARVQDSEAARSSTRTSGCTYPNCGCEGEPRCGRGWTAERIAEIKKECAPSDLSEAELHTLCDFAIRGVAPVSAIEAWTPMTESTPDRVGDYFVHCNTGYTTILYWLDGEWWESDKQTTDSRKREEGYWNKFVTHWRPLPSAPTDDRGAHG